MGVIADALRMIPSGPPSAPADLDALVRDLRVEVRYSHARRLLFDGATCLDGPVPHIELAWVKPSSSPSMIPWAEGARLRDLKPHNFDARTRFTLAHEIGHVLLHRLASTSNTPLRLTAESEERACDNIAANLLMPTDWFRGQLGASLTPDLRTIRWASGRAGSSLSATIVRARALAYQIGGAFLARDRDSSWYVLKAYGLRESRGSILSANVSQQLNALALKQVTSLDLDVACGAHTHSWSGEIRRTFSSAAFLITSVDGAQVPSSRAWRCTQPCQS